MNGNKLLSTFLASMITAATAIAQTKAPTDRLHAFKKEAAKFKSVISLPQFELTTNEVRTTIRQTIAVGNAALDTIAAIKPGKASFENTVRALDDIGYQIGLSDNRLSLIKETSTNAVIRDAATEALKELEEWMVGLDYREDVYKVVKAYADKKPKLDGEDAKLLAETLRDYRRAGLQLPKAQRDEVEKMRKELSRLTTDFESNVTKAQKAVKFTKAELEGVPDSFLAQTKTGEDEYTIKANVTWHYLTLMENAKREETRKRFLIEHDNLARAENIPLLEKVLPLRDNIAKKLGYKTGMSAYVDGRPKNYRSLLALPGDLHVKWLTRPKSDIEFVHLFATSASLLKRKLESYRKNISPDGMIWVSWPKKSSEVRTDITEDTIRDVALPMGLVDIKVCAVDEVWSGLKLVIRKEQRI
jgi:Zn-dependent oligopeptidase